jgi:hypothetical protein
MLVKKDITDISDFLTFKKSDISLIKVADDGDLYFKIEYSVNLPQAIGENLTTVLIEAFDKDPGEKFGIFSSGRVISQEEVINAILLKSSRRRKSTENREAKRLLSVNSDITKLINDSIASRASSSNLSDIENLMKTVVSVELVDRKNLKSPDKALPILQQAKEGAENETKGNYKNLAKESILLRGESPIRVLDQGKSFVESEDSLKGTGKIQAKRQQDNLTRELERSIIDQPQEVGNVSQVKGSTKVPVARTRRITSRRNIEILKISKSLLVESSGDVYFQLSLVDSTQNKLSSILTRYSWSNAQNQLPSGQRLDPYRENSLAKEILKNSKKETQESSTDIKRSEAVERQKSNLEIWAKLKNSTSISSDESTWRRIGTISKSLPEEFRLQSFIQKNSKSSAGLMQIRFVDTESKETNFTETVYRGISGNPTTTSFLLGDKIVAETDEKFSAVTAFIKKGRIEVQVTGIETPGVVTLLKRDLTLNEKNLTQIDGQGGSKVIKGKSDKLVYDDYDVKPDHVYEYRAKLFSRRGKEIITTGKSSITYKSLNDNAVKIDVSDPVVTVNSEGSINISFDVSGKVPDTGIDILNESLENQGLAKYFEESITSDRSKLSNLLAYKIDRVDLKTGMLEDMGIITTSTFSDSSQRALTNTSPLRSNRTYRYVISSLVRVPDTLLDSATRTEIDPITKKPYTFKPARFLKPSTITRGTLPSSRYIAGQDIDEDFIAGFAGVQKFIDVKTTGRNPTIVSSRVVKLETGAAQVSWRVQGALQTIDHFLIITEKLGMQSIAGRIHGFSRNGAFVFEDSNEMSKAGEVTYYILTVFNDYSRDKLITAGTVANSGDM